jgi:hypothetical protein
MDECVNYFGDLCTSVYLCTICRKALACLEELEKHNMVYTTRKQEFRLPLRTGEEEKACKRARAHIESRTGHDFIIA